MGARPIYASCVFGRNNVLVTFMRIPRKYHVLFADITVLIQKVKLIYPEIDCSPRAVFRS